jgi:hypothetical protein
LINGFTSYKTNNKFSSQAEEDFICSKKTVLKAEPEVAGSAGTITRLKCLSAL